MTKIAKILGVGRSAISRKFDGRHNMTLETLADLAFALDRPVRIELPERISVERSNHQDEGLRPESKLASITTAFMQDARGQARSAADMQQHGPQQIVETSTMPHRIAGHIDQTTIQRGNRLPVYDAIATFDNAQKALFEQDRTGAKQ
jgi:transcriptional regulator with XRE-family HTH domain